MPNRLLLTLALAVPTLAILAGLVTLASTAGDGALGPVGPLTVMDSPMQASDAVCATDRDFIVTSEGCGPF